MAQLGPKSVNNTPRLSVGSGVFGLKGSKGGTPSQIPYSQYGSSIDSPASNDQLLLVLRELREREKSLSDTQEQLEQYRRKFSVIIHQQGVLYKEYQDTRTEWEEERRSCQNKMEELKVERDQSNIKTEELERLHQVLSSDPDTTKQKLGEMSRRVTKLRVSERVLLRRCSLLETSQTGLRKEVAILKQSVNDIQLNCTQQLSYLQRYKESANYKLSSLHKQLSESVPLSELEETKNQLTSVSNKYQALLASRVAMATGQAEERIRELSLAVSELKLKEEQLNNKLREKDHLGSGTQSQLEADINGFERTVAKLKQDNSLLAEKADMLEQQLEMLQGRREEKEREMETLRQHNTELSTSSDHKTTIAQLQHQLLTMKRTDNNSSRQLELLRSKVLELEAQLLQCQQKCGGKDDTIDRLRTEYTARIRKLTSLLLAHQRQYSGACLLPNQEKLFVLISEAEQDREKAAIELREAEEERAKTQDRHTELLVQQRNLQELFTIIKEGQDSVSKITEWHSKLGEMRLKELQQQRSVSRLEERVRHLREQVASRDRDMTTLEQRLVQTAKKYEDVLLLWEEREKELTRGGVSVLPDKQTVRRAEGERKEQDSKPKVEVSSSVEGLSQLQSTGIARCQEQIRQLEVALSKAEEQSTWLRAALKSSGEEVVAKDSKIMQLEHRVRVLEERLVSEGKLKESHSQRAIKLATDTVEQIQAQLTHKEGQLERYQHLLQENKREHFSIQESQRQEIDKLTRQVEALNKRLMNAMEAKMENQPPHSSTSGESEEHVLRIKELQDVIKELEESNREMTQQFEQEREVWTAEKRELQVREEERKKETKRMKMKHNLEVKELQGTLSVKTERVCDLEEELEVMKSELSAALESSKRSPSKNLCQLVEKLRVQLTEKEEQLESLREALQQVRSDLVETAQRTVESHSRQEAIHLNVQQMINERASEVERKFVDRIRELSDEVTEKEQLLKMKEKALNECHLEYGAHKEKLLKIEKDLQSRSVELEESENSCKQLKREIEDSQKKEETLNRELTSSNRELAELRERCALLQSRVDKQAKQIKTALAQEQEKEKTTRTEPVLGWQVDNKHSSVEVARWEEGKKWQKKFESVKSKLLDKNKELESLQKQISSLKEVLRRSEREKSLLQDRLKSVQKKKSGFSSSVPASDVSGEETFALKSQIHELNNQIAELKQRLQEEVNNGMKQLQEENILLKQCNTALQAEIKSFESPPVHSEGKSMLSYETALRQELLETKKQFTQLQFKSEQALLELPRLRARVEDLQKYIEILKSSSSNHSDETKSDNPPGLYTAGEVEKIVSAMKKVIEQLQSENNSLKKSAKKQQRGETERMENKSLKEELEKARQTLVALGETGNGDTPLMTVIAENDRLRTELKKEVQKSEKQLVTISRMKMERAQLEEELTKFSVPRETIVREQDRLRQENEKLKTELETFDPQFFEEIEDLKINYQEAVRKNVEYEEQLQLLSSQYGFTLSDNLTKH